MTANEFLFGVVPYVVTTLAVVVTIVRWRKRPLHGVVAVVAAAREPQAVLGLDLVPLGSVDHPRRSSAGA